MTNVIADVVSYNRCILHTSAVEIQVHDRVRPWEIGHVRFEAHAFFIKQRRIHVRQRVLQRCQCDVPCDRHRSTLRLGSSAQFLNLAIESVTHGLHLCVVLGVSQAIGQRPILEGIFLGNIFNLTLLGRDRCNGCVEHDLRIVHGCSRTGCAGFKPIYGRDKADPTVSAIDQLVRDVLDQKLRRPGR